MMEEDPLIPRPKAKGFSSRLYAASLPGVGEKLALLPQFPLLPPDIGQLAQLGLVLYPPRGPLRRAAAAVAAVVSRVVV